MTDQQFTADIKIAMNEVVIPALKEHIHVLMNDEREYLFKQFCETRHERTIDALQRALAAILTTKEGSY